MPQMLVPVDFSTNSKCAYAYALKLSEHLRMDIKLLHVYNRSFVPNEPMQFDGEQSLELIDENRLKEFAQPHPTDPDYLNFSIPPGVSVSYDTVLNLSVADGIRLVADDDEVEMIVMGTTNKKGFFANWLGSTSTSISETTTKPVLLIPPDTQFRGFKHIMVANHYETTDSDTLTQLSTWARLFDSTLHFVYIIQPTDHFPYQYVAREITETLESQGQKGEQVKHKISNLKRHNVAEGLEQYAVEHAADLIVIVNHERSKWTALLQTSLTQRMALTTKLPLLVIHNEPFFWTNA